jgi:hypothetical protein|tara:strand:+ start:12 stop:617 length:606 start_codon:yes stop_codon:yes gene_type:complete
MATATANIDLVNRSLALLGVESITSLSDTSKPASTANLLYDNTRAAVFRAHPWNCLTKRAALAQDATAPVYEYTYRYILPADYLRLLTLEEPVDEYQLENGFILSNDSTLNIKYTALETDVTKYDTLLVEALTARLAADLAQPLLQSMSAMEAMQRMYELKIREAKFVDAQENSQDILDTDYWLESRLGVYRENISTPPRF